MNLDTFPRDPTLIQDAARRLAARPGFLAHVFSIAFAGDVSLQRISQEMNCSEAIALRLSLVRAPDTNSNKFLEDIDTIINATGIEKATLLGIIRQCQVLEAFEESSDVMLLAARDRLDHPEESDGES